MNYLDQLTATQLHQYKKWTQKQQQILKNIIQKTTTTHDQRTILKKEYYQFQQKEEQLTRQLEIKAQQGIETELANQ